MLVVTMEVYYMARRSKAATLTIMLESEIMPQLQILYDMAQALSEKLGLHSERLDSLDKMSEKLALLCSVHERLLNNIDNGRKFNDENGTAHKLSRPAADNMSGINNKSAGQ